MKYKKKGAYSKAIAKPNGLFAANGVLLVRGQFSQTDIDEFNGNKKDEKFSFSNRSSKDDLEEYGRTVGIELDKRKSKKSLSLIHI